LSGETWFQITDPIASTRFQQICMRREGLVAESNVRQSSHSRCPDSLSHGKLNCGKYTSDTSLAGNNLISNPSTVGPPPSSTVAFISSFSYVSGELSSLCLCESSSNRHSMQVQASQWSTTPQVAVSKPGRLGNSFVIEMSDISAQR
jgi:hypothetical protein